jgi:superfamily II DNA or RNA helicase
MESSPTYEYIEGLLREHEKATGERRKEIKTQLDSLRETLTAEHGDPPTLRAWEHPEFTMNTFTVADLNTPQDPNMFVLSPHQIFLKKWMSIDAPNKGVLLFHNVGVGKTCTSIQIAENFTQVFKKRVLVILPSSLKDNFRNQLFNVGKLQNDNIPQCTGNEYLHQIPDRAFLPAGKIQKRAQKLIDSRYQLLGIQEFVNIVEKKLGNDPELISKAFSDRLIIVDEVHNLRKNTEAKGKRAPEVLKHVIASSHNTRLVLLSATPMFDTAEEIQWLMELLYANDRLPFKKIKKMFDDEGKLTPASHKQLAYFGSRYVSYMRGDNPFIFPARIYPSINEDQYVLSPDEYPTRDAILGKKIPKTEQIRLTELVGVRMSAWQQRLYDALSKTDPLASSSEGDDEKMGNDLQKRIQISNIAYPDPLTNVDDVDADVSDAVVTSYGETGFYRCFEDQRDKKILQVKYKLWVLDTLGPILSPKKMKHFSPKMSRLLKYISTSEGIVFVYSRYLASGVLPLAVALEHMGLRRHGAPPLLVDYKEAKKEPKLKGEYIILSGSDRLSPNNDEAVAAIKTNDNADGSKIKVVLVTEVGVEGIDFKNIREIHILDPWYNMNRIEQIIGRGVRNLSHIQLPPEKHNTTIFHYVNLLNNSKKESIDFRMYRMSENKQKRITQIERTLKQHAIDCHLNRNVLVFNKENLGDKYKQPLRTSQGTFIKAYKRNDKAGSRICDFTECELTCQPPLSESTKMRGDEEVTKYAMLQYEIDLTMRRIAHMFTNRASMSKEHIRKGIETRYRRMNSVVLDMALYQLITYRTMFVGTRGQEGYMLRKNDLFYFQPKAVDDIKLLTHERDTDKDTQSKLLPLPVTSRKSKSSTIPDSSKGSNVVENNEASATTTGTTSTAKVPKNQLLRTLKLLYTSLNNDVFASATMPNEPEEQDVVIWDMVLDRLNNEQTQHLVTLINTDATLQSRQMLLERLAVSLRAIVDLKKGRVEAIEMLDDDTQILRWRKGTQTWESCDPVIPEERALIQQLRNMKKEYIEGKQNIQVHGFIGKNKNMDALFKMINMESDLNTKRSKLGSICVQTSTFKVDKMDKWIGKMASEEYMKSLKSRKATKSVYCTIYEYWMRARTNDTTLYFLRPALDAWWKKINN